MKNLIENYKVILNNINESIATSKNSGSISDVEKFARLKAKKFAYMTFITELERLEKEQNMHCTNIICNHSNAQKLIDIMFEVAMTIKNTKIFRKMSNETLGSWVREQLKGCGFETKPCGSSWGVLKK